LLAGKTPLLIGPEKEKENKREQYRISFFFAKPTASRQHLLAHEF